MSAGLHEDEPSPPRTVPARIGKYQVLRHIAQGGMAEIFLASASGIEGFEKVCVIKRILPHLATEDDLVELFLDEARLAVSLHHSNIAQVFDVGTDAGRPYFVMELLRGEDLHKILKTCSAANRPVPLEHVVSIIAGICAGLHYAHDLSRDGQSLQLVHRDVSPQNIFVTYEGGVKLCDFGIAKSTARNSHTRTGTIRGKIQYMSPEQVQLEPLDRRSDVFSLSIVLWELLAGRRLFSGKNDLELFKAITLCDVKPPSTHRSDVPPELDAIVMRGLKAWPKDRYQSARELQVALEEWAFAARLPASQLRLASFMTELFGPASEKSAEASSTKATSSELTSAERRRQGRVEERSRTVNTAQRRLTRAFIGAAIALAVGGGIAGLRAGRHASTTKIDVVAPPVVADDVTSSPPIVATSPPVRHPTQSVMVKPPPPETPVPKPDSVAPTPPAITRVPAHATSRPRPTHRVKSVDIHPASNAPPSGLLPP